MYKFTKPKIQSKIQELKQKQQEIKQIQTEFSDNFIDFLNFLNECFEMQQAPDLSNQIKEINDKIENDIKQFQERVSDQQIKAQNNIIERQKQFEQFIGDKRLAEKKEVFNQISDLKKYFDVLKIVQNKNAIKLQELLQKAEINDDVMQTSQLIQQTNDFDNDKNPLQSQTYFEFKPQKE